MKNESTEPRVAIFWVFEGKIILDSIPLSEAQQYGTALNHPTSHIDHWTRLQSTGQVPVDVEYEEPPRGRVLYDQRWQKFHLLADKCILGRRDVVTSIMNALHLPPARTTEGRDEHYRCYQCLYSADEGVC